MPTESRTTSEHRHPREWIYGSLVALPPLLLLSVLALGGFRELRASRELDAAVSELEQNGQPVDSDTLQARFDRRTSDENAVRWKRILDATGALSYRFYPTQEVEDFKKFVAPAQPWDAEAIASRYSDEAQPILTELEQLLGVEETVWQPVLISDHMPELQQIRGVVRLLANEVRVAYHADDHQRAIHTLALIREVAEAFDWQALMITEQTRLSFLAEHRSLIRESVAAEYWTDDELDQLRKQLAFEEDLDVRWRQTVDSGLVWVPGVSRLGAGEASGTVTGMFVGPFGVAPTHQLAILHQLRLLASIEGTGTASDWQETTEALEAIEENLSHSSASIVAVPFANPATVAETLMRSLHVMSSVYARSERDRRWTLCALAIRKFEMQEGHWPESLADLERVGLSRENWHWAPGVPLGYQVSDDGSEAFLWTSDPSRNVSEVGPVPPHTLEQHTRRLEAMEIRLRRSSR